MQAAGLAPGGPLARPVYIGAARPGKARRQSPRGGSTKERLRQCSPRGGSANPAHGKTLTTLITQIAGAPPTSIRRLAAVASSVQQWLEAWVQLAGRHADVDWWRGAAAVDGEPDGLVDISKSSTVSWINLP
jgi:hypothetical protein